MRARLETRLVAVTMILAAAHSLAAQSPPVSMPAGSHVYNVRGFYQGDEMDPWTSELFVGDTTFGNDRGVRTVYQSRESGGSYQYSSSASWSVLAPVLRAEWINGGQPSNSSCSLLLERGALTGKLGDGSSVASARVAGAAVPDFAIGAFLASRTLAAGDTIKLTMLRCHPERGGSAGESQQIVGVVKGGEEKRGFADHAEPVWIVEGDKNYSFVAVIAKSDHMLLRSVTPQGSVGYSVDSYVRTR